MGFDPAKKAGIECLTQKSVVPAVSNAGSASEGEQQEHTIKEGDFQPTDTFLEFLKAEVAHEMETLWDRSDPTQYPSLSDHWQAHLEEAGAHRGGCKCHCCHRKRHRCC